MYRNMIVLNGPSSAGKTTLTKELQNLLAEPYLHLSADLFWNMAPAHTEGISKNFPKLKYVFLETAQSLVRHGHNLVVDIVGSPTTMAELREILRPQNAFYVAVTASLPTLIERELKREDRTIGMSESQYGEILREGGYDLQIDTTHLTPRQAADKILLACRL